MATEKQLIRVINVRVKPECREEFIEATRKNARQSLEEPGVVRFDLIQQDDDPDRFVLIEAYRNDSAPDEHKKTEHYAKWRDTVSDMMAEPRQSIACRPLFPERWT